MDGSHALPDTPSLDKARWFRLVPIASSPSCWIAPVTDWRALFYIEGALPS